MVSLNLRNAQVINILTHSLEYSLTCLQNYFFALTPYIIRESSIRYMIVFYFKYYGHDPISS